MTKIKRTSVSELARKHFDKFKRWVHLDSPKNIVKRAFRAGWNAHKRECEHHLGFDPARNPPQGYEARRIK